MNELSKIVLVKSNGEKVLFNDSLSSPNAFLFSHNYLYGNLDKAIIQWLEKSNKLIINNNAIHHFAPIKGGLTVIDCRQKKIYSLNHFIQPGKLNLVDYKVLITFGLKVDDNKEKKFHQYHQDNVVLFVNDKTKDKYRPMELFGTNQPKEIILLIDKPELRIKSNAEVKKYGTHFPVHYLKPANLDFQINTYNYEKVDKMLIDLHQSSFQFDIEDIKAWYQYTDDINQPEAKVRIKDYIKTLDEKNELEKNIIAITKVNPKQKL